MKTCSTPWCRVLMALVLLVALAASPVSATEEADAAAGPAVDEAPAAQFTLPVTVAGMQVAIDAETGRLRPPTPAEAKALADAFQQTFGGDRLARKTIVRKDAHGMLTAHVDLSLLDHYVAEVQADGTLATRCVSHSSETGHSHAAPEEK